MINLKFKLAGLLILIILFIMGCSGNYGNFKWKTGSELKAIQQELLNNWSNYDIWLRYQGEYVPTRISIIIFDKKNDDKRILVGSSYIKVKDQEMWTEIVKANAASDEEFNLVWDNWSLQYNTGVTEVWGSDNQLYGFIIKEDRVTLQRVEQVDENTIRISWRYPSSNPSGW